MPESKTTNDKIKQLRESLGLSLSGFAKALGFTGSNASTTAWRWEKGIRQPSKQTIILMEQLAKKRARIEKARVNGSLGGRPPTQPIVGTQDDTTRPTLITKENKPLGNTNPTNPTQNLKEQTIKIGGVGDFLNKFDGFGGFSIELETSEKLRDIAPGWDQHLLLEKYNSWNNGKPTPNNPQAAFIGWAKSFTKGQRPR